jgi:hypothetical protein
VQHFNIPAVGSAPFIASTAIIGTLAAVASLFPAWRAVRLSPLAAIRNEPGSVWRSVPRAAGRHVTEAPRMIEFGDAARAADSFGEAVRITIETLSTQVGASTATLATNVAETPRTQKITSRLNGR